MDRRTVVVVAALLVGAGSSAFAQPAPPDLPAGAPGERLEAAPVQPPSEACPGLDWPSCHAAATKLFDAKDYASSLPMFAASCERGRIGASCSSWGWIVKGGLAGQPVDEAEGARIFELGCTRACVQLADLVRAGRGVAADPKRAFELVSAACRAKDGWGCYHTARSHHLAKPPAFVDARTHYAAACSLGVADACHELGRLAEAGAGAAVDLVAAFNAYLGAKRLGRAESTLDALRVWRTGRVTFTGAQAEANTRDLLGAACDLQDWESCVELGWRLQDAFDAVNHKARVRDLATRGCEAGHASACRLLGWHLDDGDQPEAKRAGIVAAALLAYERGCGLGDAESCARVGELHAYECMHLACDETKARTLLAKGCTTDKLEFACVALADLAYTGAERLDTLRKHCAGKVGLACLELAKDPSVAGDKPKARAERLELLTQACDLGQADGCYDATAIPAAGENDAARATRMRALFGKACALGQLAGCVQQAFMLIDGRGGPADVPAGDAIMERVCPGLTTSQGCSTWCSKHASSPACGAF